MSKSLNDENFYLNLSVTPTGTPTTIVALRFVTCEYFLSTPYSNIAPNVPALKSNIVYRNIKSKITYLKLMAIYSATRTLQHHEL